MKNREGGGLGEEREVREGFMKHGEARRNPISIHWGRQRLVSSSLFLFLPLKHTPNQHSMSVGKRKRSRSRRHVETRGAEDDIASVILHF